MQTPFVDCPTREQYKRIFDILPVNTLKLDARGLMAQYQQERSEEFQEGFLEGLGCALSLLNRLKSEDKLPDYSELEQDLLIVLGAASRLDQ
jgi:hypothetical protein